MCLWNMDMGSVFLAFTLDSRIYWNRHRIKEDIRKGWCLQIHIKPKEKPAHSQVMSPSFWPGGLTSWNCTEPDIRLFTQLTKGSGCHGFFWCLILDMLTPTPAQTHRAQGSWAIQTGWHSTWNLPSRPSPALVSKACLLKLRWGWVKGAHSHHPTCLGALLSHFK